VEKEAELDGQFADSSIDATSLDVLVTNIASLEAKIRITHLLALVEQRALLGGQQLQMYDELRGYNAVNDTKYSHSH
jgi:hypothetical protein